MFVVLDTNVLVRGRYRLHSNDLVWLTDECATGSLTLVIPEIVIRETVNRLREEATQAENNLQKAVGALKQFRAMETEGNFTLADDFLERYEKDLRNHIKITSGRTPAYEGVPHSAIVERALARRKPFGTKDVGYRDTLLWEAVLATAAEGQVALITDNVKDFGAKEGGLHSDLKNDLIARGLPEDRVELHQGLAEFRKARSASNEDLAARVRAFVSSPMTTAQVQAELDSATSGWNAYSLPEPEDLEQVFGEAVSPESVDLRPQGEFMNVDVVDARSISDGPAIIELTALAETHLSALMHKADYFSIPDDDDRLSVVDADWNDHYMEVATTTVLRYSFEGRFGDAEQELTDLRVVNVEVPDQADN